MVRSLTAVLGVMILAGCGKDYDNVASCEDFVERMSCGDEDFADFITCADYGEKSCDLAAYFECLESNTECVETADGDAADTSAWPDCEAESVCD